MNTSVEPAIIVHMPDGQTMKFVEFESGLYYYDTAARGNFNSNPQLTNYTDHSFLNTVDDNKSFFTKREVRAADNARSLYRKLGRPSEAAFQRVLKNNLIHNCPVTPADAKRAIAIYGPDIATLKGKTVKRHAEHVPSIRALGIPPEIIDRHSNATVCMDFMYVNGNPFFTSISRDLQFRTIASVSSRSKATILRESTAVTNMYSARGFTVANIHADREFKCIEPDILPINMNITDADDHVPEIERSIRTIKERVRSTIHGLPFKRLPRVLVRGLCEFAVTSLNQIPSENGVSTDMSPASIVTGKPPIDFNKLKLEFGTYAQVFEDNNPTNSTNRRTTGAIAMNPSGSAEGGYFFLSLLTGKRLSRQQFEVLPMPEWVIQHVEDMAEAEDQRLMNNGEALWEWRPGQEIEDFPAPTDDQVDDNVSTDADDFCDDAGVFPPNAAPAPAIAPADLPHPNEPVREDIIAGPLGNLAENDIDLLDDVPNDAEPHPFLISDPDDSDLSSGESLGSGSFNNPPQSSEDTDSNAGASTDSDISYDVESPDSNLTLANAPTDIPSPDGRADSSNMAGSRSAHINSSTSNADTDSIDDDNTPPPRRSSRPRPPPPFELRFNEAMANPDSTKSYTGPDHQFLQMAAEEVTADNSNTINMQKYITGFIFNQMSAKEGIRKHGQKAIDALFQEFCQLHDKSVFEGIHASDLTYDQRRTALRAVNLIKEKRTGKIKGRTCANGKPQRKLFSKEETTSPTISTDALMLSILIDAKERRDVAVADVEGAYLHADMDVFTVMKLVGVDVDIMCNVDSKYKKFVIEENGQRVLYLQLLKALYGCVRSALLWYELFATTLKDMGFVLNPYDPCVANKMIQGKQCTVVWYVDDNKISHVRGTVVTSIIEAIESKFGKMTVTRGNTHEFLGMKIRYNNDGTASIGMKQYLLEALNDFSEDIKSTAATPAQRDLFDIDDTKQRLNEKDGDLFHSIVAKLLYVSKRARSDIQLPIAFLCTRVAKSTTDDWKKLRRVLQYLKGTLDDELTLGADDMPLLKSWIDASYAVHHDMKSHTGGVVSLGRGAIMCKSTKQKLNTKSSTEAEVVGASDFLPSTIWARYFLEAQGYELQPSTFYQDNQSAMKLEVNGRKSCGQKSRHIDIRYFFIKDRVESGEIKVVYCPTEEMLADFFTKPLQGNLFRKFREVIMGRAHIDTLQKPKSVTFQERVGINMNQGNGTDSEIKTGTGNILRNKNQMTSEKEERDRQGARTHTQTILNNDNKSKPNNGE